MENYPWVIPFTSSHLVLSSFTEKIRGAFVREELFIGKKYSYYPKNFKFGWLVGCLGLSSESSAGQRIHMKNQALYSLKDKSKKLKCHLLQFLFDSLRVKPIEVGCSNSESFTASSPGPTTPQIVRTLYPFTRKTSFITQQHKKCEKSLLLHWLTL